MLRTIAVDTIRVKNAWEKTVGSLSSMAPMLLGVLLLISLLLAGISDELITSLFTGNALLDPLFGAVLGSIAAGNPVNSYIIGAALLDSRVTLLAVTAFIVCWASVGVVQAPAEAVVFGKRFTILRNAIAFLLAIIISVLTVYITGVVTGG